MAVHNALFDYDLVRGLDFDRHFGLGRGVALGFGHGLGAGLGAMCWVDRLRRGHIHTHRFVHNHRPDHRPADRPGHIQMDHVDPADPFDPVGSSSFGLRATIWTLPSAAEVRSERVH